MAEYNRRSRLKFSRPSEFKGNITVLPNAIKYDRIESVDTFTITADTEYRPDLISFRMYGQSNLGWLIMGFNGFDEVSKLKRNTTIKIPSLDIFSIR